jgi:hypothetical protein
MVQFELDGVPQPTFFVDPGVPAKTVYLYNQTYFASNNLSDASHTLVATVRGSSTNMYWATILFDYAVYTYGKIFFLFSLWFNL